MHRFSWSTPTVIGGTHKLGAVAAAVAVLALAACADSTGTSLGSHSQLAFSVGGAGGAAAALAPQTVGGHTLDLTQATLTIDRAELKPAATDSCAGDNEKGDDDVVVPAGSASADRDGGNDQGDRGQECAEVKVGPQMVNLPLDGNLVTIPADSIPAGTFRQIELRVSQVELKGTFDGVAFDDTIPVRARAEIEFDTPVVVVAGQPTTITVNVPVNTWLVNPDGSLVDPATLATNPTTLAQVRNRIAASLRAFEDNNQDGRDDHGGQGRD